MTALATWFFYAFFFMLGFTTTSRRFGLMALAIAVSYLVAENFPSFGEAEVEPTMLLLIMVVVVGLLLGYVDRSARNKRHDCCPIFTDANGASAYDLPWEELGKLERM